jgi:hypothetical protein
MYSNQTGLLVLVQASPLHCKNSGHAVFYIGALHSQFDRSDLLFAGLYLDVYCIQLYSWHLRRSGCGLSDYSLLTV